MSASDSGNHGRAPSGTGLTSRATSSTSSSSAPPVHTPPVRTQSSRLDQYHAQQRTSESRWSTARSVGAFVMDKAVGMLPGIGTVKSAKESFSSAQKAIGLARDGELRKASAAAVSSAGSALSALHVPIAPHIFTAASHGLQAQDHLADNQGHIAMAIKKTRESGMVPKDKLDAINLGFKKGIGKND